MATQYCSTGIRSTKYFLLLLLLGKTPSPLTPYSPALVLYDAFRIVTGCLRPTPIDTLPIFSDIQPAEFRRLGATISFATVQL